MSQQEQRIVLIRRAARIVFLGVMLGLFAYSLWLGIMSPGGEATQGQWWAPWLLALIVASTVWLHWRRWHPPACGWDLAWERADAAFRNPDPFEPSRARGAAVLLGIKAYDDGLLPAVAAIAQSHDPDILVGALQGLRDQDLLEQAHLLELVIETYAQLQRVGTAGELAGLVSKRATDLDQEWDWSMDDEELLALASAFVPADELLPPPEVCD